MEKNCLLQLCKTTFGGKIGEVFEEKNILPKVKPRVALLYFKIIWQPIAQKILQKEEWIRLYIHIF